MKFTYLIFAFCLIPFISLGQWTKKGLDIDGEDAGDKSGFSTSFSSDGNTVIIGAPGNDGIGISVGHARVFEFIDTDWVQKGADIDGEESPNFSGWAVDISSDGNIVAIGAPLSNGDGISNKGHVGVFEWDGSEWIQKGEYINGEVVNDKSGESVTLSADGNTVAIGSVSNDDGGADAGHVRVFEWSGSAWVQKGVDIDGDAALDNSGFAIDIRSNGNILAIGAINNDGNGTNSGHVRVFEWSGSAWIQKGVDIDGENAQDKSGTAVSLSLDGSVLAIGAMDNDDNGSDSGHVRIFEWGGTSWAQKGEDIDGEAASDRFGGAVELSSDGNTIAISAHDFDTVGIIRVYEWNGTVWGQKGIDLIGESEADGTGSSKSVNISADGNKVVFGDPRNSGIGLFAGHIQVYEFCSIDNTLSIDGIIISSNSDDSNYQWLDCNTDYSPIIGANSQNYNPIVNGTYAVEITNGICIDTSICVEINSLNIVRSEFTTSFNVYPNPTDGLLHVEVNNNLSNKINIIVCDITGKICSKHYFENDQIINFILEGEPGVYFVEVSSNLEKRIVKVLKK